MTVNQGIVLALGSNQALDGDSPADLLTAAIGKLDGHGVQVKKVSRFFMTPCFPEGAGPDYVNAAVLVITDLSPDALLQVLHEVEAGLGRQRGARWASRTVDIDLIAFGERVLPDLERYLEWRDLPLDRQVTDAPDCLILPHPRLQDRAFVLVPMLDVAPDWRHPVLGLTVRQLCSRLPKTATEQVRPL